MSYFTNENRFGSYQVVSNSSFDPSMMFHSSSFYQQNPYNLQPDPYYLHQYSLHNHGYNEQNNQQYYQQQQYAHYYPSFYPQIYQSPPQGLEFDPYQQQKYAPYQQYIDSAPNPYNTEIVQAESQPTKAFDSKIIATTDLKVNDELRIQEFRPDFDFIREQLHEVIGIVDRIQKRLNNIDSLLLKKAISLKSILSSGVKISSTQESEVELMKVDMKEESTREAMTDVVSRISSKNSVTFPLNTKLGDTEKGMITEHFSANYKIQLMKVDKYAGPIIDFEYADNMFDRMFGNFFTTMYEIDIDKIIDLLLERNVKKIFEKIVYVFDPGGRTVDVEDVLEVWSTSDSNLQIGKAAVVVNHMLQKKELPKLNKGFGRITSCQNENNVKDVVKAYSHLDAFDSLLPGIYGQKILQPSTVGFVGNNPGMSIISWMYKDLSSEHKGRLAVLCILHLDQISLAHSLNYIYKYSSETNTQDCNLHCGCNNTCYNTCFNTKCNNQSACF